jgi:hypothetical protein
MSRTIQTLAGLLLVMLSGCAALERGRMDPKVAALVTLSKNDPVPGCEYLGTVRGATVMGDLGDAHGEVLRNAVLRGGNFVSVDMVERPVAVGLWGYVVRGRLFACPTHAPAQATQATQPAPASTSMGPGPAASPVPRAACEPECATGFTCELGACVAAPTQHAAGPTH